MVYEPLSSRVVSNAQTAPGPGVVSNGASRKVALSLLKSHYGVRVAARHAPTWIALVMLVAVVLEGCGDAAATCVPGKSIACSRGGCSGHQVCRDDGKAYDECICPGSDPGEFPSKGPNSGLIGAACASAADCRLGFDCLTSDSRLVNGQGPSAGICLQKCLPEHDFCPDFDARSKCIVLSDAGTPSQTLDDVSYCLPGCELGTQPNELDKCRGRVDLVCAESPTGSGVGFCRPACRSDLDCAGRYCDLGTGLCSDATPTGSSIGSSCGSTASSCAGGCIDRTSTYSECCGVCRYGTPGCGQQDQDPPLDYFCLLDPTTGSGDGDLGYCARLCDCDDDCGRSDAVCEPNELWSADTGRSGVCGSRTLENGDPRTNTPC
jgi:hypothetical protein